MTSSSSHNFDATVSQSSTSIKKGIFLSFDEVISTLPVYLQPSDEQEQNELAMFLSQINHLHKPTTGKLSATSILNFLEHLLRPATFTAQGPSQVTFSQELQEFTENIAIKIASSVNNVVDLHNTTISLLKVLKDVSWETKATLMITTFVLTFGDKGLNLCEDSNISMNEIQMFAMFNKGLKHRLEDSDNIFRVVSKLVGAIVNYQLLPPSYMTTMDPNVKVARTHLIVTIYWIMRIIVAASTSYIMRSSSTGNEFDKAISRLWKLYSRWSKKLEDLDKSGHLSITLSHLQDLLDEDIDIEAYNKIMKTIEEDNKSDNMKVLNALIQSTSEGDTPPLYDCLHKRKANLDELKGEHVLLFISGTENIAPEVDATELNEFIHSIDQRSENIIKCNIVWMPIVDKDRQPKRKEVIERSMEKPFMDWCYVVHQKLYQVLALDYNQQQKNLKGWYSVSDPSRLNKEVKKVIRHDWKYKKGEPIIVVLDPQGNVLHHNAIHLIYIWGVDTFPFTSEKENDMWKILVKPLCPVSCGLRELHDKWKKNHDEYIFYYGSENMEWIRSFTRLMCEVAKELQVEINMVYVGRNHNQELEQSVKEANLSHCLSNKFYKWLFWKRINSIMHSFIHTGKVEMTYFNRYLYDLPRFLHYQKSNVDWVIIPDIETCIDYLCHGKLVLSTLKDFKIWKESASNHGFLDGFISHYNKLYRKIFPFHCRDYPSSALKAPIGTMLCPDCNNHMQQITTFVCYHQTSKR